MNFKGKKLAIIGASYLQLPLVLKAKSLGIKTLCFAWEDGAVCRDYADQFFPISIIEKEKIARICAEEKIDGITTIATDVAVPTVNHVAQMLHLVGNSERSARLATNKYLMRKALREGGVHCPYFSLIKNRQEAIMAVSRTTYPVIVKPCDRSGSMGVTRVESEEELASAVDAALGCSFCKEAILEKFVDIAGEISIEGISWRGEYQVLAVTDKVTTGTPHYVELGQHQPSQLPQNMIDEAVRQAKAGIGALGIEYGASHSELMVSTSGEIFMTEIGSRMGGDFIGSDLVYLSTGYDFLRGVIEVALGEFQGVRFGERHHAGVWFYSPSTPEVKEIIDRHELHPELIRWELHEDELKPLTRSADRAGYLIYQGNRKLNLS